MHNLQEPPPIELSVCMHSPHLRIFSILIINVLVFYFVELNCFRWRIPPHMLFKSLAGLLL